MASYVGNNVASSTTKMTSKRSIIILGEYLSIDRFQYFVLQRLYNQNPSSNMGFDHLRYENICFDARLTKG
jgi:hypothetical protein